MSKHRSKRHHYNPRLILRGFADTAGLVVKRDLRTGRTYEDQPIQDVTQARNFYTVVDSNGERSALVEEWLGRRESTAAPAIGRLVGGQALQATEWMSVAALVAIQRLRVPAMRVLWADRGAELELLRPSVEALPEPIRDRNDEVARMLCQSKDDAEVIASTYVPIVLRCPPRSLLTSDTPVLMVRDRVPVGLSITTARALFLALNDSTGLLLWNTECYPSPGIREQRADLSAAQDLNRAVVAQSLRQILWHPGSDADALLGEDFVFPPERTVIHPVSEATQRMARALQWASENTNEEHPLARLPPIEIPDNARPLSASLRRRLYDAGFFS